MMCRYIKAVIPLVLIIAAALPQISCNDDGVGDCFGVNLEQSGCVAEDILAIGTEDGLACFNCTGQETGDVFTPTWQKGLLAGTSSPGTIFSFLHKPELWLAEFTDCGTIMLFETSKNEFGRLVKGDFAGTLEDLNAFQIDKLSLFINMPGVRVEEAVCDFCANSTPPQCFDVIID
jgi:hypothetical protein